MDDEPPGRPLGRRAFLGVLGLSATSLVWGDKALQLLERGTSALPAPVRAAVPVGGRFRIYAVNLPYPTYDPATWRLRIDGMVRRPQTFDMAALRALPQVEQVSDFHCVTGWSVEDCRWRGVRFSTLLDLAGVEPGAVALDFISTEKPYVDTLTLEQLEEPDALLAFDLDGEPLTREMGAPARVIFPKMYAYKGVKWLERIRVVDQVRPGYWEQRGYDRDPWVDGAPA